MLKSRRIPFSLKNESKIRSQNWFARIVVCGSASCKREASWEVVKAMSPCRRAFFSHCHEKKKQPKRLYKNFPDWKVHALSCSVTSIFRFSESFFQVLWKLFQVQRGIIVDSACVQRDRWFFKLQSSDDQFYRYLSKRTIFFYLSFLSSLAKLTRWRWGNEKI